MEIAFYAYTILIMTACVAAAASTLSLYAVTRNALYLCVAAGFFLYFLDLMLIFLDEYLGHGTFPDVSAFYAIHMPFAKSLLAMGVLESIWVALCLYLDKRKIAFVIAPAIVFLATNVLIVHLMPEGPVQQWCFYSTREAFIIGCLGFLAFQYRKASVPYKASIRKLKAPAIAGAVLCACIIAENSFMILIWQPTTEFMNSAAPLFISERNISENLLALVLSILALRHSVGVFRLRYKEPPEPQSTAENRYVDSNIDLYCEKYGLTRRERDILRCIVAGKDYQNTASELCLAVGTIKSHTHNILQKTGAKTRQDLQRDFWRS